MAPVLTCQHGGADSRIGRPEEFANSTLTPEERRERAERARAYMAERFGHYVSDEESAEMGRKMRAAAAAHRAETVGR